MACKKKPYTVVGIGRNTGVMVFHLEAEDAREAALLAHYDDRNMNVVAVFSGYQQAEYKEPSWRPNLPVLSSAATGRASVAAGN